MTLNLERSAVRISCGTMTCPAQKAIVATPLSKRVTHAYFGKSSMPEALLFCVRHLEHHQKQLPSERSAESQST
jgi:hypothetical protein